jgi:hypothetical protein
MVVKTATVQVPKYITERKQFGVFPHANLAPTNLLMQVCAERARRERLREGGRKGEWRRRGRGGRA